MFCGAQNASGYEGPPGICPGGPANPMSPERPSKWPPSLRAVGHLLGVLQNGACDAPGPQGLPAMAWRASQRRSVIMCRPSPRAEREDGETTGLKRREEGNVRLALEPGCGQMISYDLRKKSFSGKKRFRSHTPAVLGHKLAGNSLGNIGWKLGPSGIC